MIDDERTDVTLHNLTLADLAALELGDYDLTDLTRTDVTLRGLTQPQLCVLSAWLRSRVGITIIAPAKVRRRLYAG